MEFFKSECVPTRIIGDLGLYSRISGIHFNETFKNEVGETTEKQTINQQK